MKKKKKNIDSALVETTRPPLYTALKYWGKKPHNIWNTYIKTYTGKHQIYLDPFCGSAMSAFEALKANRKAIAFDLNPLTSFVIETVCSTFNESIFLNVSNNIISKIKKNLYYRKLYCYRESNYTVQNVKWNNGQIYEVCLKSNDNKKKKCVLPQDTDIQASDFAKYIKNDYLYPNKKFRKSKAFNECFLKHIGNTYDCLYTKRNLYILSIIFDEILKVDNDNIKKQLLFAFIQTVHLSTKMCVPRSKKTNRDFSTSWGRSAFLFSKKQMEMNPLLLFENNCYGKQSISNLLIFTKKYFNKKPNICCINEYKYTTADNVDLWYGIIDAKKLSKYLPPKSVDFILTDPPYGDLVRYFDLSSVWLTWLELYDSKYLPDYKNEISNNFKEQICDALKEFKYVLKDNGKLVLTFNNKDISVWNSFLTAINESGFKVDNVIFQHNKRSGESNVYDSNGSSSSDFYFRCSKSDSRKLPRIKNNELERLIVSTAKNILIKRNEPTSFTILFNCLIIKILKMQYDTALFQNSIESVLNSQLNKNFVKIDDLWWIKNKKISKKNNLSIKAANYINKYFYKNKEIKLTDLYEKLYKKFNEDLILDEKLINNLIKERGYLKNKYIIKKGKK